MNILIIALGVSYLSLCLLMAITEIGSIAGYGRTCSSLPYGDEYLVETPVVPSDISVIKILFFPAFVMVKIWKRFCRLVRKGRR